VRGDVGVVGFYVYGEGAASTSLEIVRNSTARKWTGFEVKEAISEWGLRGVELLRDRVAALVIVDVLSFSTAVDVVVARGGSVVPFATGDREAARIASDATGALLAEPRETNAKGFSFSPRSLMGIAHGTKLLLPSPNGSRLSLAGGATLVFTGCLRNAKAVAAAVGAVAGNGAIGVVPAGELWNDGSLRPAIEDLLGAGAILDALDLPLSSEARVARDAFRAAEADLAEVVRGSLSGRELTDRGFEGDIELAAAYDVSTAAPMLRDGSYQAAN
jgi:2-phosphosulfolactate phosphatase